MTAIGSYSIAPEVKFAIIQQEQKVKALANRVNQLSGQISTISAEQQSYLKGIAEITPLMEQAFKDAGDLSELHNAAIRKGQSKIQTKWGSLEISSRFGPSQSSIKIDSLRSMGLRYSERADEFKAKSQQLQATIQQLTAELQTASSAQTIEQARLEMFKSQAGISTAVWLS